MELQPSGSLGTQSAASSQARSSTDRRRRDPAETGVVAIGVAPRTGARISVIAVAVPLIPAIAVRRQRFCTAPNRRRLTDLSPFLAAAVYFCVLPCVRSGNLRLPWRTITTVCPIPAAIGCETRHHDARDATNIALAASFRVPLHYLSKPKIWRCPLTQSGSEYLLSASGSWMAMVAGVCGRGERCWQSRAVTRCARCRRWKPCRRSSPADSIPQRDQSPESPRWVDTSPWTRLTRATSPWLARRSLPDGPPGSVFVGWASGGRPLVGFACLGGPGCTDFQGAPR